jgi:hypothetical protein
MHQQKKSEEDTMMKDLVVRADRKMLFLNLVALLIPGLTDQGHARYAQ